MAITGSWLVNWLGFGIGVAIGVGAGVFALLTVIIYLRGYLVPRTPELTTRYAPSWVLDLFGKRTTLAAIEPSDLDVGESLRRAGIVVRSDSGDFEPTEAFRTDVQDRSASLGDQGAGVAVFARLLCVDPEQLWVGEYGSGFKLVHQGKLAGRWPSSEEFRADMTAVEALADRLEGWTDTTPRHRSVLLAGCHAEMRSCPRCDGTLEATVGTCCGSTDITNVECTSCETTVVEIRSAT